MSVEAVATRAAEKILPEVKRGVEIFFRLLVLPLGLCFCEQSGGMTKTTLPIRFKPAWAGLSNNLYRFNKKEDIGDLEEMEHLISSFTSYKTFIDIRWFKISLP